MMVRRTMLFPGRRVVVNGIEPEVGALIDVPEEVGAQLISRGDFQDGEAKWPPVDPNDQPVEVVPELIEAETLELPATPYEGEGG